LEAKSVRRGKTMGKATGCVTRPIGLPYLEP
jgi:hypothetical protein